MSCIWHGPLGYALFKSRGHVSGLNKSNKTTKKTVNTLSYRTESANAQTVDKQWLLVDASDVVLGRLASVVAKLLRGKHKTNFTPHVDCGDNVVIINASKVVLTGNKEQGRELFFYSGYPGGRHDKKAGELLAKNPVKLVEHAIKGMLPKTRLGEKIFGNVKVYAGPEHKQEAQQPKAIDITKIY